MYTPAKTASYESRVALFAQMAARGAGLQEPLDEALSVSIEAVLPIPASWSRRRQESAAAGVTRPTGRPDVDNVAKSVTDGCNGILWRDDSRIVDLTVRKVYGLEPMVRMVVREAT